MLVAFADQLWKNITNYTNNCASTSTCETDHAYIFHTRDYDSLVA